MRSMLIGVLLASAVAGAGCRGTEDGARPLDARLPAALHVPPAARLMAPALTRPTRLGTSHWTALMSVRGAPSAAWADVVRQLGHRFRRDRLVARSGDCGRPNPTWSFRCDAKVVARVRGRSVTISAQLRDVPEDTTDGYLLRIEGVHDRYPPRPGTVEAIGAPPKRFPPARTDRRLPRVGGHLVVGSRDPRSFEDHTGVLARYDDGDVNGGIFVLLRISRGADVVDVARAYARRAAVGDDPPTARRARLAHEQGTLTAIYPPYDPDSVTGEVYAIDAPGPDDFVYYELTAV